MIPVILLLASVYGEQETDRRTSIQSESPSLELHRISHILPVMSVFPTQKLMTAFVLTQVDYFNALFIHLPIHLQDQLQRAQNNAANSRPCCIPPSPSSLAASPCCHWLQDRHTLLPLSSRSCARVSVWATDAWPPETASSVCWCCLVCVARIRQEIIDRRSLPSLGIFCPFLFRLSAFEAFSPASRPALYIIRRTRWSVFMSSSSSIHLAVIQFSLFNGWLFVCSRSWALLYLKLRGYDCAVNKMSSSDGPVHSPILHTFSSFCCTCLDSQVKHRISTTENQLHNKVYTELQVFVCQVFAFWKGQ